MLLLFLKRLLDKTDVKIPGSDKVDDVEKTDFEKIFSFFPVIKFKINVQILSKKSNKPLYNLRNSGKNIIYVGVNNYYVHKHSNKNNYVAYVKVV